MTMPIRQADMAPPRPAEAPRPLGKPDREAADRFREALDRKGGRPISMKQDRKAESSETDRHSTLPLSGALPPPFPPLAQDRARQDKVKASDERADIAGGPSGQVSTRDATVVSAQPLATPAADVAGFAMLIARLDSGMPPSALSHLALPGDQWRADQVMIDQQAGGLSVFVDIGGQNDAQHESLNELEARLRARGMNASVSDADPNRIADVDSRIA